MLLDESLWEKYKKEDDDQAREKIILEHIDLVRYAAGRIMVMLPDNIEREDLESYGIIGLIEAIEKFDYKRGYSFSTFALPRIKGEIIDYLRRKDWLPNNMRSQLKKLKQAKIDLKADQDKNSLYEEELSKVTNISTERIKTLEYYQNISESISLSTDFDGVELIEIIAADLEKTVDKLAREEAVNLLAKTIDRLSQKERLLISLYYYEELTQAEIAAVMNISAARVSQIHSHTISRLRGMLSRSKEYF
ncbi:RNA polymerase sigma factor for flagellar operon [Halanaerobium saccharolyticum subsp. saccharolyticum DSM 6643]|uniref:RNA polymerase sigma factor for flagellar operon n=1 Tax=Halanaerobium saccharolyticum subsp. saccharolyticum DSM 6643 TaxID=1293054 RepID=M5E3B2_9FIRM|nr:FliA/WhiG family RNA polymerase sigma factor [Halanaerobium saccharolyticum]CCU80760.1 RNA polymerase sigma factor for flagellar operon [Halanaerobium saccharolyticum subsp. saccharolyticum DSM 6643]